MAIEYFCCYHSYRKKLAKLSDQEVGRLFRALLEYSETGETQELAGRESVAFDFIADDIDRARTNYESRCETNAANGKKGGRPKEKPNAFLESEKTHSVFSVFPETEKSQTKTKTKTKTETETETKTETKTGSTPPVSPSPGELFSGELLEAVEEWLAYKREKRQGYKPTGLKSLLTQIRKKADTYGEAAVCALIRECMAANWQGIIWDKLAKEKAPPAGRQKSGNVFARMVQEGVFDDDA